jgi:hypothetical protein
VRLSDEKTRITRVRDGFDFLGFRMTLGIGQSGNLVPKIKAPQKAVTRIIQRLNEVMRYWGEVPVISVRRAGSY